MNAHVNVNISAKIHHFLLVASDEKNQWLWARGIYCISFYIFKIFILIYMNIFISKIRNIEVLDWEVIITIYGARM